MSVRLSGRESVQGHPTDGIVRSGRRMLGILVGMVRTRLNLLAVELMQEKSRIVLMLVLTTFVLIFALMALLMLSLLIVVAFWDENRLLAIGGLFAFYLGAALVTLFMLRRKAKMGTSLFAGTLNELSKDAAALNEDVEEDEVDFDFERRRGRGQPPRRSC